MLGEYRKNWEVFINKYNKENSMHFDYKKVNSMLNYMKRKHEELTKIKDVTSIIASYCALVSVWRELK